MAFPATIRGCRRADRELVRAGVSVVGALFVCALLPLAPDTRDVVFLAVALLSATFALGDFAFTWTWFVLILPFVHVLGLMFGLPQLTFVRLELVGLAVVFPFANGGGRLWRALGRGRGFVAFLLFIAANVASGVHARNAESISRAATYAEPALFYLFTYCVVRRHAARLKDVVRAIVIGGGVVAALGVVEIVTQQPIFSLLHIRLPGLTEDLGAYLELNRFGLGGRIMSTIGQPVYASVYFAIWLVVAAYYLLALQPGRFRLLLVFLPCGVIVMLATGTRAPIFGLMSMLIIVPLVARRRLRAWLTVGAAIAAVSIAIVLAAPGFVEYLRVSLALEAWTPENANVLGRIDLTNRLLDYFMRSPIWGNGPGVIQHQALRGVADFAGLAGQENQYAVILADGGVLAGATYVCFMLGSLHDLFTVARSKDGELSRPGLMALALFVFYFVIVSSVTCLAHVVNYILMSVYGGVMGLFEAKRRQAIAYASEASSTLRARDEHDPRS